MKRGQRKRHQDGKDKREEILRGVSLSDHEAAVREVKRAVRQEKAKKSS